MSMKPTTAIVSVMALKFSYIEMKPKILTDEQCEIIRRAVALRDDYRCILHPGRLAPDVHHVIHRSYTAKNHPLIWQPKNMCSVCVECHVEAHQKHPLIMRDRFMKKMIELYNFDYSDHPFCEYLIEGE